MYPVAYADCFATALGVIKKSKVVTVAPEFKKLTKAVKLEWIGQNTVNACSKNENSDNYAKNG